MTTAPSEPGDFEFAGEGASYPSDAWELLSPSLTEERRHKLISAAAARTGFIRLVVQDIHHPHNVSACLRSAEAFGIADVDVVCHNEPFSPSTVSRGVAGWLRIHKHDSIDACAKSLKAKGYRLAAGVPAGFQTSLDQLPITHPVAVVFGNEKQGVAPEWRAHLDHLFTIPMVGLVESLNISVSAAITLYSLTTRAKAQIAPGRYLLDSAGQTKLLSHWICRQIRSWPGQLEILRQRSR